MLVEYKITFEDGGVTIAQRILSSRSNAESRRSRKPSCNKGASVRLAWRVETEDSQEQARRLPAPPAEADRWFRELLLCSVPSWPEAGYARSARERGALEPRAVKVKPRLSGET